MKELRVLGSIGTIKGVLDVIRKAYKRDRLGKEGGTCHSRTGISLHHPEVQAADEVVLLGGTKRGNFISHSIITRSKTGIIFDCYGGPCLDVCNPRVEGKRISFDGTNYIYWFQPRRGDKNKTPWGKPVKQKAVVVRRFPVSMFTK